MTSVDECFPRGKLTPKQSTVFWVEQKDRYLRQLLIKDIQESTGRDLVVYYMDCQSEAQIDAIDDKYVIELIKGTKTKSLDLLIETNGGFTDATEKLVSILRSLRPNFRAIVPRRAKSNGTLIALASCEIVMGSNTELGPIDPYVMLQSPIPAQFILQAQGQVDPIVFKFAEFAVKQTQKLATTLLTDGMLSGKTPEEIEAVVAALSTRDVYHSHGSVIDHQEAVRLGLNVTHLPPDDELWQKLWLLRCMLEYDAKRSGVAKIFEGEWVSHSIKIK
jgi:hypothetical protein